MIIVRLTVLPRLIKTTMIPVHRYMGGYEWLLLYNLSYTTIIYSDLPIFEKVSSKYSSR
jgi:hypothetical protein